VSGSGPGQGGGGGRGGAKRLGGRKVGSKCRRDGRWGGARMAERREVGLRCSRKGADRKGGRTWRSVNGWEYGRGWSGEEARRG